MFDNNTSDDDYDLEDFIEGIPNMLTIGLHLVLLPGYFNAVTIHLMRQVYAEKRQEKKRR
jgi:hypothetical protein